MSTKKNVPFVECKEPNSVPSEAEISRFSPLIRSLLRRYSYLNIDLRADLEQEAWLALLKARETYDPTRKNFERYGTAMIVGAIKHYLRDQSELIRLPAYQQENAHALRTANQRFEEERGRQPLDAEELARFLKLTTEMVEAVQRDSRQYSIECFDRTNSTGSCSLLDFLKDSASSDPLALVLAHEQREELMEVVQTLPEKERDAILMNLQVDNMDMAAEALGWSPGQYRGYYWRAIKRLRKKYRVETSSEVKAVSKPVSAKHGEEVQSDFARKVRNLLKKVATSSE